MIDGQVLEALMGETGTNAQSYIRADGVSGWAVRGSGSFKDASVKHSRRAGKWSLVWFWRRPSKEYTNIRLKRTSIITIRQPSE